MSSHGMLTIQFSSLEMELFNFKALEERVMNGSPYVNTLGSELMTKSYGRSFEAINLAYAELNKIEQKLVDLVGRTRYAIEYAGIDFAELDHRRSEHMRELQELHSNLAFTGIGVRCMYTCSATNSAWGD
ncbi:MAG: hypothetical protein FWD05_04510 [Oscillospiraceae bacterium]|nr:hypothetical protein [Oscillospiraceae bacterium]